ncbi:hypothetical protein QBC47DRAFT_134604 [Echria macrotheca]|uniref:SET domain-containing protein n=1 Tax=Echria macrotheca TaxID=438768 RepID=A0AAJ0BH83_9PEZI|nr:hypothetical protein QBC47DRAFT_134604 [Echria macrotheca]
MTQLPTRYLSNAPQNLPAVRIGFVNGEVGLGLFAARDFAKDEFIFTEAPILTARFNENFAADRSLMASQLRAYTDALARHRDELVVAYPRLAARFAIAPPVWEEARVVLDERENSRMGGFLVHGRYAGCGLTGEEYEAYTGRLRKKVVGMTGGVSEEARQLAILDFFKNYAFEVKRDVSAGGAMPTVVTTGVASVVSSVVGGGKGGGAVVSAAPSAATRHACIFLLGSLVNHCCTPPPPVPEGSSSPRLLYGIRLGGGSGSSDTTGTDEQDLQDTPPVGPNCSWRIGPSGLARFVPAGHICVQARRDIRAGEELTWDYGKRHKGFDCACETCKSSSRLGGFVSQCGVI